jgi:hypothetical protein
MTSTKEYPTMNKTNFTFPIMKQSEYRKQQREKVKKYRSRRDRVIRYLKRCEVKLINDLPTDLDSLIKFYLRNKHHKNPGFCAFSRHCLTNYDDLCGSVYSMFGIGMDEEMRDVLQKRAHEIALPYLKAIGFIEWHCNRKN